MIVVKIGDGLGNQIYNYVCGYAAARKTGQKLKLDTSDVDNSTLRNFMLDKLTLDEYERESFPNRNIIQKIYKRLRRNIKYKVIFEDKSIIYSVNQEIFKKSARDKYLHGYWQIIDYFNMYKEDILRQIRPNWDISENMLKLKKQFQDENTCGLHFRGGDIAMLPKEYYIRAIDRMREKKDISEFICFSNEKDMAESILSDLDIRYKWINDLGDFSDIEEFFLLSYCRNQIISDSTFSRWAAIINDNPEKMVVAPSIGEYSYRVYPEEWELLG